MSIACRAALLALLLLFSTGTFAAGCGAKLLVSGYFSTVHIYDACSGAYLRDLDSRTRIQGAQATRLGPDGNIWVVSEETGKVLRYRADTFEFVDVFATVGINGATGLDFAPNGDVYVGFYKTSVVNKYNAQTGQSIGVAIAAGSAGLRGADNGLRFGPDGKLYVPGYDSNSVVRYDPLSGAYEGSYVPAGSGGIRQTRGLLFSPDGNSLYITAEGSGQLLRVDRASGSGIQTLVSGLNAPTGMDWHPDGSLLVVEGNGVVKRDPQTGALRSVLVQPFSGGLSGSTFVTVLPDAAGGTPDPASIGSQYWVSGLALLNGRVLDIPDVYTTLGTGFGSGFDPAQIQRVNWGTIRMNFTSCTEADFSWNSTGEGTAGFGSGSYKMYRILRNQASDACESAGVDAAPNAMWAAGSWYGGEARSGEGLQLDADRNGLIYLTWFTHRPAAQ